MTVLRNNVDQVQLKAASDWLKAKFGAPPPIGVVLGSGLGAFAESLTDAKTVAYSDVPHAPESSVQGHAGKMFYGRIEQTPVVALSGRVHAYEGHALDRVAFLVRALAHWGVPRVLLTNAAGAVNTAYRPAELMLIVDHLNLTGLNPLMGVNDDAFGQRFVDFTHAYDRALSDVMRQAAQQSQVGLREGVYAQLIGPNYETPAEIRMLRVLGADAVGMSTVPETVALRHMGVRVAALSCITNMGAGILGEPLSHSEVKTVADQAAGSILKLLKLALPRMAEA